MSDKPRSIQELWTAMHKIVVPGEYGLGNEEGSFDRDDKHAWEELGKLLDEMQSRLAQPVAHSEICIKLSFAKDILLDDAISAAEQIAAGLRIDLLQAGDMLGAAEPTDAEVVLFDRK